MALKPETPPLSWSCTLGPALLSRPHQYCIHPRMQLSLPEGSTMHSGLPGPHQAHQHVPDGDRDGPPPALPEGSVAL